MCTHQRRTQLLTAIAEWVRRCDQDVLARLGCPFDPFTDRFKAPGERTLRDVFARFVPAILTAAGLGIAHSINKSWDAVHDLYTAANALSTDADEPWNLPIYGGRPVPHSADADPSDPPLMLLEPPEVSQAAQFLTAVSFDELWSVVEARFSALGWTKQEHIEHHRDLQEFYGQAASAGHAVVKAVWA
ncbi:DUF1877 family protein [Streptomyces sp. Qhu_M48]|uniref:DUF1877 family protein n=1 Tax=Streptomyces sp. Qhu_M48 TaxID=3435889 RepID=UPI003F4F7AA4